MLPELVIDYSPPNVLTKAKIGIILCLSHDNTERESTDNFVAIVAFLSLDCIMYDPAKQQ